MILCKTFPREVAMPQRRNCQTEKEFYEFINKYNKIKQGVFFAIYSGDREGFSYVYHRATIDKIFFDFDSEKAFDDVCQMHQYCMDMNYKHLMVFSGGQYHFYIFCKNGAHLQNNKAALLGAHNFFVQTLNVELDPHIKGDVARISRVPNTWNGKHKRFCIPIDEEDLKRGDAYIREKAQNQNFKFTVYGTELFDIGKYDGQFKAQFPRLEYTEQAKKVILADNLLRKLPLCIAHFLKKGDPGWRERFLVIVYFRDKGYLINETIAILEKYLEKEKFEHCVYFEKQVQYLYSRPDLMFPLCERLEMEGFCWKNCKHRNKVYR